MEQTQTISLLLIVALPMVAGLLGLALHKWRDVAAYLCIAALLVSAALSISLLRYDASLTFTIGAISLPSETAVRSLEAQITPEMRPQYFAEIGSFLAENPAVQALPIQFQTGSSQLLFAATCALIAV